jgi:dTDP-4-amino-4,6-dideoxygalactose transaminase
VLIEDAAQAIRAEVDGRTLGGIGHLAALSFHETKNVSCGEGGALLVNDARFAERAQIVHDKGTDRSRFFRGQVDKYTWVDHGSSYVLSDLAAAYLWAQLERVDEITDLRLDVWHAYEAGLAELATGGDARLPIVPPGCRNNAHVFYLIVDDPTSRAALISALAAEDINAVFHYVPLHSSEAGRRFGRAAGELPVTDWVAERLVRLPLWAGMTTEQTSRVVEAVLRFFGRRG